MKSQVRGINDPKGRYDALMFWCPGCEFIDSEGQRQAGAHMLPISGDNSLRPTWTFNGNTDSPTLSPSILTRTNRRDQALTCHSFLVDGVFNFLHDCTHKYAGQMVPIPDMPDWLVKIQ